jgi:tyrosyl-tRNA synthetase
MSIPDNLIIKYFIHCTRIPMVRIRQTEKDIQSDKLNPRDAKLDLASEITKIYHGEKEAEKAKEYFIRTFSQHKTPEDIQEVSATEGEKLVDIIVKSGNAKSISDARRKIEQGGVEIDGEKIADWKKELDKDFNRKVIKVGKFGFTKIKFQ